MGGMDFLPPPPADPRAGRSCDSRGGKGAAELDIDGLILKGHESGGRVGTDTTFILLQRWVPQLRRARCVLCHSLLKAALVYTRPLLVSWPALPASFSIISFY